MKASQNLPGILAGVVCRDGRPDAGSPAGYENLRCTHGSNVRARLAPAGSSAFRSIWAG
jgi:hypothetical protein